MSNNFAFESWGRFPKVSHLGEIAPSCVSKVSAAIESVDSLILPRGQGRSYGDSCLNEGGYLLSTKWLNKFYFFDPNSGLLRCESGVTFDEILRVFVPKGWFLPVTPGTKFVTVGGAIANDIHGKNHHKAGSFGNHVIRFELQRSDGTRILCSKDTNFDWFKATIGGLGLTGVILWAEFRLKPIQGPYIEMESIKFESLDEFLQISKESERDYEYTVSWLDCLSDERKMGRGIFMRGNHSDRKEKRASKILHRDSLWKTFPVDAPRFFLSTATVKIFNFLYYHKQVKKYQKDNVHYDAFFYPLDKIKHWNRMYGKRGFLQWQCVVPITDKNEPIKLILQKIIKSKLGSFLVVLKEFGNLTSEGMLSFPMPGITLALDFPNVGKPLFSLLDELDKIVVEFGGRIYPAKDARMSSKTFYASFPEFENFVRYVDPKFSSSFYKRVKGS
jgi:FAD/FMN-containing dehydrogenase